MNKLAVAVVMPAVLALVSYGAMADTPIASAYPPDLVAYWPADGSYTDVIAKIVGQPFGGVSFAPGKNGRAFGFDGTGRIHVPDSPSLRLTHSLALTAWIKVTTYPSSFACLFFRGDDRVGLDPYRFYILSSGKVGLNICDADNNQVDVESSGIVALNTWTFVAASLDDSTGDLSVYINGTPEGTITTQIRPFATLDPTQNPGVGIGNTQSAGYSFYFTGLIDELKVYDDSAPAAQPPS